MKEMKENILGMALLFNIGYLIWGDYDGYIPYISLSLLLFIGWKLDKRNAAQTIGKRSKKDNYIYEDKKVLTDKTPDYTTVTTALKDYEKLIFSSPIIIKDNFDKELINDLRVEMKEDKIPPSNIAYLEDYLRRNDYMIDFDFIDPLCLINQKEFRSRTSFPILYKNSDLIYEIYEYLNEGYTLYLREDYRVFLEKGLIKENTTLTIEEKEAYINIFFTVDKLRGLLRDKSLKNTGKKEVLVKSILENDIVKIPPTITFLPSIMRAVEDDINIVYKDLFQELLNSIPSPAIKEILLKEWGDGITLSSSDIY